MTKRGYIPSSEAFHRNVVSVYIKPASSPKNTLSGINWTRVVLEDFGSLSSGHTGPFIRLFVRISTATVSRKSSSL
jgi:hypothetical protein